MNCPKLQWFSAPRDEPDELERWRLRGRDREVSIRVAMGATRRVAECLAARIDRWGSD